LVSLSLKICCLYSKENRYNNTAAVAAAAEDDDDDDDENDDDKLVTIHCQVLEVAAKNSGLTESQQDGGGNFASLAVRISLHFHWTKSQLSYDCMTCYS